MHAAQRSALQTTVSGSGASVTMSEIASRPSFLRTRAAARNTRPLSGARLMTPLEMTQSATAVSTVRALLGQLGHF